MIIWYNLIFYQNKCKYMAIILYISCKMEDELKMRIKCSWKKLIAFLRVSYYRETQGLGFQITSYSCFFRWSSDTTWCPPVNSSPSLKFESCCRSVSQFIRRTAPRLGPQQNLVLPYWTFDSRSHRSQTGPTAKCTLESSCREWR